jgi:hypothetical protein
MDVSFVEAEELILQTLRVGFLARSMLLEICIEDLKKFVWEGQ